MRPDEIGEIVNIAKEFGVRKVKITGGEPLLRGDLTDIVASIADQKIENISLVTNGTLFVDAAKELADAGLDRVNLSLDTLDGGIYTKITGKDLMMDALAGIDAAVDTGFDPVKLNMVLLSGVNDGEVDKMIEYASQRGAVLQLIELLQTQDNKNIFLQYHQDLGNIEQKLSERASRVQTRRFMHNRKKFILPQGEVEVVRPMDNTEFCMHCTRLRLTPDGYLKLCLLRSDNLVDVLSPLRSGEKNKVRAAFKEAIARREPYFKSRPKSL